VTPIPAALAVVGVAALAAFVVGAVMGGA